MVATNEYLADTAAEVGKNVWDRIWCLLRTKIRLPVLNADTIPRAAIKVVLELTRFMTRCFVF